jgi:metal-responsive CopG/Arc/MetJ family transcriptional regulator
MTNIKTAISLPESLFEQAEALSSELKVSRSRLMAIALEEFIRRHQNQQLLEKINSAYADFPDEEEQTIHAQLRHQHRKIAEEEW